LVLCTLFTLFAREVVTMLFTDAYLPAVKVCQLQVWFVFLMGVNSLIGTILGATDNEKLLLRLGVANAVVSTPLLYFGSYYGALGLSYGYVISFAVFEIYVWFVFKRALKVKIDIDVLLWVLAVAFFILSYFIPVDTGIIYRLMFGTFAVVGLGLFFRKSMKPALAV